MATPHSCFNGSISTAKLQKVFEMRNWAWREYRAFRAFRASPMIYLSQRTQSRKVGLSSLSSERSEAKSLRLCAFARALDERPAIAAREPCAASLMIYLSQRTQRRKAGLSSLSSERSEAKSLRLCAFARDPDEAGHDDCVRTLCGQPHDLSLAKSAKAQSRPDD